MRRACERCARALRPFPSHEPQMAVPVLPLLLLPRATYHCLFRTLSLPMPAAMEAHGST